MGTITAQSFFGDGSGLTGITATGTGIGIRNDGSTVGTAGTINFGSGLSVSSISGGVVTVSASNANNINISAINSTDTTTSVVLVSNQTTGFQSPFIDSGLSYNADTNALTATSFVGNLQGNATSATTATNATNANNINISETESTDTSTSVVLVGNQTRGNQTPFIDSGIRYNASTKILDVTTNSCTRSVFSGPGLTGGAALTSNVTLTLGTPSSITSSSTNSVSPGSHTHELSDNSVTTSKLSNNSVTTSKLSDDSVTAPKLSNNSVTAPKLNGSQTGPAPVYGVRAWGVMSNGTTLTPSITRSGNIQSVSRNENSYTFTFAVPMPNAAYAVSATIGSDFDHVCEVRDKTTSGFVINTFDAGVFTENNARRPTNVINIIVVG